MVLNRNPDNFFNENEQLAFCPALVVPGITYSDDKLLQTRIFRCVALFSLHKCVFVATVSLCCKCWYTVMVTCNSNTHNKAPCRWHAAFTSGHLLTAHNPHTHAHTPLTLLPRSYADTQRHRLGPNYLMLPVNAPRCPARNNHHDGLMNFAARDEEVGVSYARVFVCFYWALEGRGS